MRGAAIIAAYVLAAVVAVVAISLLSSFWVAMVWTACNVVGAAIHARLLREAIRDRQAMEYLQTNGRRLLVIGINARTQKCLLALQATFAIVGLMALAGPHLPSWLTQALLRGMLVLPIPMMAVVGWLNNRDRHRVDAITDALDFHQ